MGEKRTTYTATFKAKVTLTVSAERSVHRQIIIVAMDVFAVL
jgi:hypothetical protein